MSSAAQIEKKQNKFLGLIIKYPVLPTLIFFLVIILVFTFFSPINRSGQNVFLSPINLANIVESTATLSIGAFAMTLILLVGCIDLSAESIISLCGITIGICLEKAGMIFG